MNEKKKKKPSVMWYRIARVIARVMSAVWFKRRIIKNELKGQKRPYVIIANHQAALDFANLMGVTRHHIHFVISNSFFNTIPIRGLLDKAGMIPKQQFQTELRDLKRMRAVIDEGGILALYPAGLMCEDGLSTPIPVATYKFLQWLRADIYMAKTYGTYFAMPKWSKKKRPGRTLLEVYKLFDKDEIRDMSLDEIKERTDKALLFDAYREQEELKIKYRGAENIEGLEKVLYICPHCKREHTMRVKNTDTIYCESCGFEERCDEYGFLHKISEVGEEIRYVSDWSRLIYKLEDERIGDISELEVTHSTKFQMIDYEAKKFVEVGEGSVKLVKDHIYLTGTVKGEPLDLTVSCAPFASLPFSPGKYFEVQHGEEIYRCYIDNGDEVMKFINTVKILYERNIASRELR